MKEREDERETEEEKIKRYKGYQKKYRQSEKGKACIEKYNRSEKGKENSKKYYEKNKDKINTRRTAYVRKRYRSDPEYREKHKAKQREYLDRHPEQRIYLAANSDRKRKEKNKINYDGSDSDYGPI